MSLLHVLLLHPKTFRSCYAATRCNTCEITNELSKIPAGPEKYESFVSITLSVKRDGYKGLDKNFYYNNIVHMH